MGRALTLGEQARRRTPPNPWVGAVVVRDGEVVGEGATRPPGGPHAEVEALREAGDRARGATVVRHARTVCRTTAARRRARDALARRRAWPGSWSPSKTPTRTCAGAGVAALRERGRRRSTWGSGATRPRARSRRTSATARRAVPTSSRRPRRASTGGSRRADGTSRWITGAAARADAHRLRADSQAVVVGAGTAIADRPQLTVRDSPRRSSTSRCASLLDARGRVPADGAAVRHGARAHARPHHRRGAEAAVDAWLAAGAKVEAVRSAPMAGASTSTPVSSCSVASGCSRRSSRVARPARRVARSAASSTGSSPTSRRSFSGRDAVPRARHARPGDDRRRGPLGSSSTSGGSATTSGSITNRAPCRRPGGD